MTKLEQLLKMVEVGAVARGVASKEWPDAVSILWFALRLSPADIAGLDTEEMDQAAVDLIHYAMNEGPRPAWYPADQAPHSDG